MTFWSRNFLGLSIACTIVALIAAAGSARAAALAQYHGPNPVGLAALGAFMIFGLVIALAMYIYWALALQTIAQKTNTPNGWLAWIPIVNLILMINVAKKPVWWFLLCLIPLVNIIILVIIWMGIAEARHKPNWWGILLIVPIVNLIVPGYLAWAD